MKDIELLKFQTSDAYNWTHKLLNTIPFEKWDICPAVIYSTLNWQVGHLIVSHYYHAIMVIKGHQMGVLRKVPMKEYDEYFTNGNPELTIGKVAPQTLLEQLSFIHQISINILQSLNSDDLHMPLVSGFSPHPIAKTKLEALDWNIKHTMYHCGQIGILKRVVDERYDFGLKR